MILFTAYSVRSGVIYQKNIQLIYSQQWPCRHKRLIDDITMQHVEGRVSIWQK